MHNQGTIQQDVSRQNEQQPVVPPQMQRREQQYADILQRVEDEVDRQVSGPVTTEQHVRLVDDPAQYKVRVKLAGEEKELVLADVVAGYQKNEVASERLRLAGEKQRELEQRERALRDLESQLQLQNASLSNRDADTRGGDQGTNDDLRSRLTERFSTSLGAMVEGNTDDAVNNMVDAVLAAVQGRQQTTPTTIDVRQIASQVKQTIDTEQVWDRFLADNPEFREEYDGQGQPVFSKEREYGDFLYDRDYRPRVERGELSYHEALMATASDVKKVLSLPAVPQQEEQQQPHGQQTRQARKQSIDNIAVAAGARSAGPVVEQEESRSSILNDMRRSRGLPSMM